jgi:hypothetical protein
MANGEPQGVAQGFATIIEFEAAHAGLLADLMEHFAAAGKPFATPEALMADMLDDVVDVWWDEHFSREDPCGNEPD